MNQLKPVPQFKTEEEERFFWQTHDSAEFLDWKTAEKNPSLANLKPSSKTVSIRLPDNLVNE